MADAAFFLGSHLNDSLAGYRILCLKCFYPFIFLQYRNVLSFRVNFHFQKLLAIVIAKLYMCICILKRFLWGFYYSGMIQFHNSLLYNMSLSFSLFLILIQWAGHMIDFLNLKTYNLLFWDISQRLFVFLFWEIFQFHYFPNHLYSLSFPYTF